MKDVIGARERKEENGNPFWMARVTIFQRDTTAYVSVSTCADTRSRLDRTSIFYVLYVGGYTVQPEPSLRARTSRFQRSARLLQNFRRRRDDSAAEKSSRCNSRMRLAATVSSSLSVVRYFPAVAPSFFALYSLIFSLSRDTISRGRSRYKLQRRESCAQRKKEILSFRSL